MTQSDTCGPAGSTRGSGGDQRGPIRIGSTRAKDPVATLL